MTEARRDFELTFESLAEAAEPAIAIAKGRGELRSRGVLSAETLREDCGRRNGRSVPLTRTLIWLDAAAMLIAEQAPGVGILTWQHHDAAGRWIKRWWDFRGFVRDEAARLNVKMHDPARRAMEQIYAELRTARPPRDVVGRRLTRMTSRRAEARHPELRAINLDLAATYRGVDPEIVVDIASKAFEAGRLFSRASARAPVTGTKG